MDGTKSEGWSKPSTKCFRGIQERDAALQGAKGQLEDRVQERTEELRNEVKERQEAEAAMRLAKDAAEGASKAKSEF
jgi:C4-dicarboxylate-specific signal transduction histidine kinase